MEDLTLYRKKKQFDIVSLMGGKRTTGVAEQNPKQHSPRVQKDPPQPNE